MEVILKKDIPNVGRVGELVKVKNGFARNYLFPREWAVVANTGNKKELAHHLRLIEISKKQLRVGSEEQAKEVQKIKLKFEQRFNENGKMFGALTASEMIKELKAHHGLELDRRDLEPNEIRTEGKHKVKVRLPGDVYAEIQVEVKALKEDVKEKAASGAKPKSKKATKESEELAAADAETPADSSEAIEG
jgi:large subunit ribosomal protein L9